MSIKLVHNWGDVLKWAWSVRLMLLAGVFSGLEQAVPLLDGYLPHGVFAALSGVSVGAAFVARMLYQEELSDEDQ